MKPERDKLNFDRNWLNGKYATLKDEVSGFEQIRRDIYHILREEELGAWRAKRGIRSCNSNNKALGATMKESPGAVFVSFYPLSNILYLLSVKNDN